MTSAPNPSTRTTSGCTSRPVPASWSKPATPSSTLPQQFPAWPAPPPAPPSRPPTAPPAPSPPPGASWTTSAAIVRQEHAALITVAAGVFPASFQAEVFRAALRDPLEPALHDRRVAISQRLRQVFPKRGRNVLARVARVDHRSVALAWAVDAIQQVDGVLARVLLDQRLDAVPALVLPVEADLHRAAVRLDQLVDVRHLVPLHHQLGYHLLPLLRVKRGDPVPGLAVCWQFDVGAREDCLHRIVEVRGRALAVLNDVLVGVRHVWRKPVGAFGAHRPRTHEQQDQTVAVVGPRPHRSH